MLFSRFLAGNISNIILVAVVLLLKRLLKNRLSSKFHYHIWLVLLLSLLAVFIPVDLTRSDKLNNIAQEVTAPTINIEAPSDMPSDWRYEFTEVIDSFDSTKLTATFYIIWMIGALCVISFYCIGHRKLHTILRFSEKPSDDIFNIFNDCCKRTAVRGKISLLQSCMVTSPLTFGYRTFYVILPESIIKESSAADIERILLHELTHIKHKDTRVNFWFCVEQVIYWFNPIVWWAFSQMRRDREVYCDWAVLNTYPSEEERLRYGETLLQLAVKKNSAIIYTANWLFSDKAQIRYRIKQIANFKRETQRVNNAGRFLLCGLSFIVLTQVFVLSAFASDFGLFYSPNNTMNIVEADYSDLFNGISGCAIVFDAQSSVCSAYNVPMITKRVAPCSTCKIYSALNALEHGIITPENNMLMWDRINRDFPEWNRDQTLRTAIRNSVNWYFQILDQSVGADELEQFYQKIGYGNGYIGDDTAYYWNGRGLRISPLEQIELLIKLYYNDFSFDKANTDAVKEALFVSDNNGNKLYGKTGTGTAHGNDVMGWFVGYVETENNVYFVTVSLQDEANANGDAAVQIAYSIFEGLGIHVD